MQFTRVFLSQLAKFSSLAFEKYHLGLISCIFSAFRNCIFFHPIYFFLCLRLLEKRRHYVIGLSERVKECKSVNATGIPNKILSTADANPRLTEI